MGLAVGAGIAWGLADFIAAERSRALYALTVLAGSQAAGLVAIAFFVVARHEPVPPLSAIGYAMLAGISATLGLGALYRGFAVGRIGVVAPIAALGPVIPIGTDLLRGESLSASELAGLSLALGGVVLVSRESTGPGRVTAAAGAGLGAVAAVCFGLFFITMDQASKGDVYWATFIQRVAAVGLLALAVSVLRPPLSVGRANLAPVVAIGVLDTAAVALYAQATTLSRTSLAAVLASLYPVVTVVLARLFLGENLSSSRQVGLLLVFTGIALAIAG